ncbi:MAG: GNAT family N-acetyltransferase [Pseudomonadota bacterium]|nr:GNAT family N-acetyltransferase [Pseudomonadota bacterium]
MTATVTVRAAAPRDLKTIVAMCDALNAHSGVPTGRLDPRRFRAALFGKAAFVFGDIAFAADEGDMRPTPAGYALSHDAFTTDYGERGMYLIDLYVEPAWRRAGVGRALLAAVSKRAKARGGTHLWWGSMPGNFQARRFYAALGATDEKLHSHALFGRAFDRLAAASG